MVPTIHQDLDVWRKAVQFSISVYEITKHFPKEEQFGITAQMRRAVVSIASNISEGAARQNGREFCRFLYIARGSVSEIKTQTEICKGLFYIDDREYKILQDYCDRIGQMINGLIRSYKN